MESRSRLFIVKENKMIVYYQKTPFDYLFNNKISFKVTDLNPNINVLIISNGFE